MVTDNVPRYENRSVKRRNDWITKDTQKSIKRRDKAWKRYKEFGSDTNYRSYKKLRNEVVRKIGNDKASYQRRLACNFRHCPKRFYGYIRRNQQVQTRVGRVKKATGEMTADDEETADEICRYFTEIFRKETGPFDVSDFQKNGFEIEIDESDVSSALKKLKKDKSQGPDEIHPALLHETAEELTTPITALFRHSMERGQLPKDWKRANITPIYKKGGRDDAGNYRPISLTSVVCKTMEQIMKRQMTKFLEEKGYFSRHQHGFRAGRSCLTNLLETFESWTRYLDEGYGVDVVYLDYRKAFDSVPHIGLIEKLKAAGFGPKLVRWIEAYLEDRRMRVIVNNKTSAWRQVDSGVPQGAVLAPLLFLIYVNDLPDWIVSEIKMFADDTKIWRVIRNEKDMELLQEDLDSLSRWTEKWKLRLNVEKCKLMHIGRLLKMNSYFITQCGVRSRLETTKEERDLGVVVRDNLQVEAQCRAAAARAKQGTGNGAAPVWQDGQDCIQDNIQDIHSTTHRICNTGLVTISQKGH